MAELSLHFEFAKDTDVAQASAAIHQRLSGLESVTEVDAVAENPRLTGLEIIAAIAVTVRIVRGTRQLIEEIRKLIPQVKGLIDDLKGLKTVTVEVGAERIALADLTNSQLQQLANDQTDG